MKSLRFKTTLGMLVIIYLLVFIKVQASAWEEDTDRPGMDYRNFVTASPDPKLCEDACLGDPRCNAWTYVKPGIQGPNARCWLKFGIPSPIRNNCCVSGLVHHAYPPGEKRVERKPLSYLIALEIDAHIDHKDSWIRVKVSPISGQPKEYTKSLPAATWVDKGPAGIRDIIHNIQDLNCGVGVHPSDCKLPVRLPTSRWDIFNDLLIFSFACETGGPIEIERHPQRGSGAYDINLTRLNVDVSARMGERGVVLSPANVIRDLNVKVNVEAEIRRVPDWMEVWGIVDRKVKEKLEKGIKDALTDSQVKTMIYEAIMKQLMSMYPNAAIESVYLWGNNVVIEYVPIR